MNQLFLDLCKILLTECDIQSSADGFQVCDVFFVSSVSADNASKVRFCLLYFRNSAVHFPTEFLWYPMGFLPFHCCSNSKPPVLLHLVPDYSRKYGSVRRILCICPDPRYRITAASAEHIFSGAFQSGLYDMAQISRFLADTGNLVLVA